MALETGLLLQQWRFWGGSNVNQPSQISLLHDIRAMRMGTSGGETEDDVVFIAYLLESDLTPVSSFVFKDDHPDIHDGCYINLLNATGIPQRPMSCSTRSSPRSTVPTPF